jgi:outer membrane protein TolC
MTIRRVLCSFVSFPVLFLAAAVFVTGCAVGPKYKVPAVTTPPAYKESANWKPAQPNEEKLGGNWWEIFQDTQLNALEQQINVSNQNLKAAVAQYQEARAALRYVRADYYPTVAVSPSATRQKYAKNGRHQVPPVVSRSMILWCPSAFLTRQMFGDE